MLPVSFKLGNGENSTLLGYIVKPLISNSIYGFRGNDILLDC